MTTDNQYQGIGPLFEFVANGVSAQHAVDDICENYHKGNKMSVQANKIAHRSKSNNRNTILDTLTLLGRDDGMTCEEIEIHSSLSHQTCSARLSELRKEGKIKIVGTRKTRSGSPAAIYMAI